MVHPDEVGNQLKRIGAKSLFWCRAEIRELPKILFEAEQVQQIVTGRYEAGFALFCATDHRILLIDKKPFYLTLEDIRYDMVSDVQFNHRLIDATIRLGTMHKTITFTSFNHGKLREFTGFIQEQVMRYRQQQSTNVPSALVETSPLPAANPVQTMLNSSQRPVINPYKVPVIIRRRVSRFY